VSIKHLHIYILQIYIGEREKEGEKGKDCCKYNQRRQRWERHLDDQVVYLPLKEILLSTIHFLQNLSTIISKYFKQ